jgi:hypothetical protein
MGRDQSGRTKALTYDYVSIEKYSIFDYDYPSSSDSHTTHDHLRTEKHWTYVSTSNQKHFLPIVCVKLFGSTETDGRKGMPLSAMYAQRQLHKATIPERHNDVGRIKLQALHASVKLWDMTIHYRSGRKQMVQMPEIIYQNCESPFIDLKEEGPMESVTFSLNAVAFSDKDPVLWIWGR